MASDLPSRRILIAEADPAHRASLQTLLEDLGYSVESCADAPTSLRLLQTADAPFAALLDFELPGMAGTEICRELNRQKPGNSPWIIAMYDSSCNPFSSVGNSGNAKALESGVCDLLSKPVEKAELQLRLKIAEHVQAIKEERDRSIEAAGFQASHDPLTGLWNREAILPLLFQETDRVRRTSVPMSLMLIDLDHFTNRNLEFGYGVCDSVLQQVAVRLRRHLRSYDILGRSGEDEFLIALPGCDLDDAIAMAERLRLVVIHSPFHARGVSLSLRASFGVAQSRGRSPLIVLREAEHALNAAKEAGRDRVRHHAMEQPIEQAARRDPVYEGSTLLGQSSKAGHLTVFPSPRSEKSV